jgi:hypothetical protein
MLALRIVRSVSLVVMVVMGAACTEWHVESVSPQQLIAAQPSKVRVTLTRGNQLVVRHPSIVADTLVGIGADPPIRVPLSQVQGIATRQVNAGRTRLLIGGIATATAVVVVINALEHVHLNLGCMMDCAE